LTERVVGSYFKTKRSIATANNMEDRLLPRVPLSGAQSKRSSAFARRRGSVVAGASMKRCGKQGVEDERA
jgi:hypothetical protein